MDKETLIRICNEIYAEGFEVGFDWTSFDENQKELVKKHKIEKVLKKFGVNTTEGNNDYQGKTEALMNKIKELKEDALVRLNNNFYHLADMAKEIKETGFYPPIEEILAIAENLVFNTGEVSGLTDAIDVEVDND